MAFMLCQHSVWCNLRVTYLPVYTFCCGTEQAGGLQALGLPPHGPTLCIHHGTLTKTAIQITWSKQLLKINCPFRCRIVYWDMTHPGWSTACLPSYTAPVLANNLVPNSKKGHSSHTCHGVYSEDGISLWCHGQVSTMKTAICIMKILPVGKYQESQYMVGRGENLTH